MDQLKTYLHDRGAALVGVGLLDEFPSDVRMGLPRTVVLAVPLEPSLLARVLEANYPLNEMASEYDRANQMLAGLCQAAIEYIQARGFTAIRSDGQNNGFDRATLAARLTNKMCATRAGLGWIGKSGLLITKAYGSAVRLASIVTNAPLAADAPVNESSCGDCQACKLACRSGGIKGTLWQVGVGRAEMFDYQACEAYRHRIMAQTGWANPRCGKCIVVCPWTRTYVRKMINNQ